MPIHIDRDKAKECVGIGWHTLIDEVYDRLPNHVRVTTVKEKMGTLCIYVQSADDGLYDHLQSIQDRSATICEICGRDGKLCDGSWRKTLCRSCTQKSINSIRG